VTLDLNDARKLSANSKARYRDTKVSGACIEPLSKERNLV